MQIYSSSPVVLDGGLGTMLEEQCPSSSCLWSTQQVIDNPDAITEAHLSYMRSGARIISTATYQASLETFGQAGYSDKQAPRIMIRSIELANEARKSFLKEIPDADVRIALSLGPFGATLSPPQEFKGYYPPPYGPASFSEAEASGITNAYGRPDIKREEESITALTQFHLNRLVLFASDSATWEMVDIVAFETIPLLREVIAIRKAISSLTNMVFPEGRKVNLKPWWISFVFPGGESPQARFPGGANMTAHDLVHAVWSPAAGQPAKGDEYLPRPTGIGINCTSLEFIPSLVEDMVSAVDLFRVTVSYTPWLVLYPNGGDVYDQATRTWIPASDGNKETWASNLARITQDILQNHRDQWGGLVVGGCCRTSPDLIHKLQKLLLDS